MFAKVLLDIKVKDLDRLFDYKINENDINILEKGMRVIVPFGAQTRLGYVIDIVDTSKKATREIIEVVDIVPSISEEIFDYISVLESKNNKMLIEIIETVLPSELFLKYTQTLTVINNGNFSEELLEMIDNKKTIAYTSRFKEHKNEITRLINKGDITISKDFEFKGKPKIIQTVCFLDDSHYKSKNRYIDLIEFVKENPNLTRQQIVENEFSLSSINTLIKNEVFIIEKIVSDRLVTYQETKPIDKHTLNKEQLLAFDLITNKLDSNDIFLLKGITGSGKTEVYMHVMKEVLKNNKNILYLVPEITLIAPLVLNLKSRFSEVITHYNSNLSSGERYDAYQRIINNEAKIIVGTRSSSFLPIADLGLIIVDEEHDSSYQQTDNVQYDVLDILKEKSLYHRSPIILGSATPKVTSYYKALNNEYTLLELNKRATNQKLPNLKFVDMKKELVNGNTTIFSKQLLDSINSKLEKKEQVILLYNRKGYSNFSMCRTCGYSPRCKNCDINLTYYKDGTLKCNYCNYTEKSPKSCPTCNNETIRPIGLGIDQVYEIVKKTFPNASPIKMDASSTQTKGSHEKIWLDFKDEKYNILVGTQMVSKGLDFPKVTLVGILMADLELRAPTYLAAEGTYALLTQMVGRSGRNIYGEAIIQGYDLDNYAIKSIDNTYEEFYKEAIYYRQISKYEPFYEVSQIMITNKTYTKAYNDAIKLKDILSKEVEIVLGPVEPLIKYINNEYRYLITLKDKVLDTQTIFEILDDMKTDSKCTYISIPTLV